MLDFAEIFGLEFEYSPTEIGAVYQSLVANAGFSESRTYLLDLNHPDKQVMALPIVHNHLYAIPFEFIFDRSFSKEVMHYLNELACHWFDEEISALADISALLERIFPGLEQKIKEVLIGVIQKSNYNLSTLKEIIEVYRQYTTQVDPLHECVSLLKKSPKKNMQIFYPYIDQGNLLHLVEVTVSQPQNGAVNIDLIGHNYKASLFPKELLTRLTKVLESSFTKYAAKVTVQLKPSSVFTNANMSSIPQDVKTLVFTDFISHMISESTLPYVIPSIAPTTKGIEKREADLALFKTDAMLRKTEYFSLLEKLHYAYYFSHINFSSIFEICHALFNMAEYATYLKSFERAKLIYKRILQHINTYSADVETNKVMLAELMNKASLKLLELDRRLPKVVTSKNKVSTDSKPDPVFTESVFSRYEQGLYRLNEDVSRCLMGQRDEYTEIISTLRHLSKESLDDKTRDQLNEILIRVRRPESFYNPEVSLLAQNSDKQQPGSGLSKIVYMNVIGKKTTEIKTLTDLIKYIGEVVKLLEENSSQSPEAVKKVLGDLYTYYLNFENACNNSDPSARGKLISLHIPVAFNGRADLIKFGDTRLIQIDAYGNPVKPPGSAGQSAFFYYQDTESGIPIYSKVVGVAAFGPGYQIAHDEFFRRLLLATTPMTQIMLLSHPNGLSYLLQISAEVKGELLHHYLNSEKRTIRFESLSFAQAALIGMLLQSGDMKPDNCIVDPAGLVRYFDTDIFGDGTVKRVKENGHQLLLKSVLFCMPQMSEPVPSRLVDYLVKIIPEVFILDWLEMLYLQNNNSEKMFENTTLDSNATYKDKVIVKFRFKFILSVYYKLCKLVDALKANSQLTLSQLFQILDPLSFTIYSNINARFNKKTEAQNIMDRISYAYEEKFIEDTLSPDCKIEGLSLSDWIQSDLGLSDPANPDELLLPENLIGEFTKVINFAYCGDEKTVIKILEVIEKRAALLEKVTFQNLDWCYLPRIRLMLSQMPRLKKLVLEGRSSLPLEVLKQIVTFHPTLDLKISISDTEKIPPYMKVAISHKGRISLLTRGGAEIQLPSFYERQQTLLPLHYFVNQGIQPAAFYFVLKDNEESNSRMEQREPRNGDAIVHSLARQMHQPNPSSVEFASASSEKAHTQKIVMTSHKSVSAGVMPKLKGSGKFSTGTSSIRKKKSTAPESTSSLLIDSDNILACFSALHLRNVDMNTRNASGLAPIHMAIELNLPVLLIFLLDRMSVNIKLQTDGKKENIFHMAVRLRRNDLLKMLLDKLDKDTINILSSVQQDMDGEAAVHLAVKNDSIFNLFLEYTKKGVDFNALSLSKLIPLNYALMAEITGVLDASQKTTVVTKLLENNYDGVGQTLSELPADTAKRHASDLLDRLNRHYEYSREATSPRGHSDTNTAEIIEVLLKDQCDQLIEVARKTVDNLNSDPSLCAKAIMKSISLLISAMNVASQIDIYKNKIPVCEDKIDKLIIRLVGIIYGNTQSSIQDIMKVFMELRRESRKNFKSSYDNRPEANGLLIAEEAARKLKQLLSKSIDDAFTILGKPPGNYAIYIMGDLVTAHANLYSHLPFGIVYEEKPNAKYYECLLYLIQIAFIRLGESGHVFDEMPFNHEQAFSNQTTGVCVESSTFPSQVKNIPSLSVGIPKDVAIYMITPDLWRSLLTFSSAIVLKVDENVYGSETALNSMKGKFSDPEQFKINALDCMHSMVAEFRRELFAGSKTKGLLEINHVFFSLPFFLIEQLCIYNQIPLNSVSLNIENLVKAEVINPELASQIKELISLWLFFVTRVKNFYQADKNTIVFNSKLVDPKIFSDEQVKIGFYQVSEVDLHNTIEPFLALSYTLFRALQKFLEDKTKIFFVLSFSALKLQKPADLFKKIVLCEFSEFEQAINLSEKVDAEVKVLIGIACLHTGKSTRLLNLLTSFSDPTLSQPEKGKEVVSKDMKKDFLYLESLFYMSIKKYDVAVVKLFLLLDLIQKEGKETLSKIYENGEVDKKLKRKSNSNVNLSPSEIGAAYVSRLLAEALLHIGLNEMALTYAIKSLQINKKKSINISYYAFDLLLCIKILESMGRFNEANTYLNEAFQNVAKFERQYHSLYGEIARRHAQFVLSNQSIDQSRLAIAYQCLLRANYYAISYFGDNTKAVLLNLVTCYRILLNYSEPDLSLLARIFARIKHASDHLGEYHELANLYFYMYEHNSNKSSLTTSSVIQRVNEYLAQARNFEGKSQCQLSFVSGLYYEFAWAQHQRLGEKNELENAKILLELRLNTLNAKLGALDTTRMFLLSKKEVGSIDVSRTQADLENEIIMLLKQVISVKMKLAFDNLLRKQFAQLFDLLIKKNDYVSILEILNSYLDVQGYFPSPENYRVILHASVLYFICVSQLYPAWLNHSNTQAVLDNINRQLFEMVVNILHLNAAPAETIPMEVKIYQLFRKIISSLNLVFTECLPSNNIKLESIPKDKYQTLFTMATSYVNRVNDIQPLPLIIIRALCENTHFALSVYIQKTSPVTSQTFLVSSNAGTDLNPLSIFGKRPGPKTLQYVIENEAFLSIFSELKYVQAKNNQIKFILLSGDLNSEKIASLMDWIQQHTSITPYNHESFPDKILLSFDSFGSMLRVLHYISFQQSSSAVYTKWKPLAPPRELPGQRPTQTPTPSSSENASGQRSGAPIAPSNLKSTVRPLPQRVAGNVSADALRQPSTSADPRALPSPVSRVARSEIRLSASRGQYAPLKTSEVAHVPENPVPGSSSPVSAARGSVPPIGRVPVREGNPVPNSAGAARRPAPSIGNVPVRLSSGSHFRKT